MGVDGVDGVDGEAEIGDLGTLDFLRERKLRDIRLESCFLALRMAGEMEGLASGEGDAAGVGEDVCVVR